MEIKVCKVKELTSTERRKCRSLSFRQDGDLSEWLNCYPEADVAMAFEGDLLLGWAMRLGTGPSGYYVRKSHRRQGIGSKLYYTLNDRRQKKTVVYPHDPTSFGFFYSLGKFSRESAAYWVNPDTLTELRRKPRKEVGV